MARTFRTQIDISPKVRQQMADMANRLLANAADLHSQTKQAHWNVRGAEFISLHKLFDDLAEVLEEQVDSLAERAGQLGFPAMGTVRMAAANSDLPEMPADAVTGREFVQALVLRWAAWGAALQTAAEEAGKAGDLTTQDILTGMSQETDKGLWFLEAHLQA